MDRFTIVGARVFDGERVLSQVDVRVAGGLITEVAVGDRTQPGEQVVDGSGSTLLPGLIDAHTHADRDALRAALTFGVTTELDLLSMPGTMGPLRREVAARADLADVRSASVGLTVPDGHPHQLRRGMGDPLWPTATRPQEVPGFVADRLAEGADYLKVLVEDGRMLGTPVPSLDPELLRAAVTASHDRGVLVLVHALTLVAAHQAISAGADALTHLFVDQPHTPDIIELIASSGAFVIPTLATLAAITGQPDGAELAADPRVRPKVDPVWLESLTRTRGSVPSENFAFALATVAALHQGGVDVLAGTDASAPEVPGLAHGASLHDELRLLVRAGLTPVEALRAATVLPARRFGLSDRGRIAQGLRADLLLVAGDPTTAIDDSLSVQAVWRQGARLPLASACSNT
ncbi:amidohydrolase family protein [Streptomyces sp. NPDC001982]|uniref:amidohydrolase family protein n=1 Tax=Streptomyces sp. NPDC001982 TaxID=3154405 RepID=UPI003326880A